MSLKSFFAKRFAARVAAKVYRAAERAEHDQLQILAKLIEVGQRTQFGRDHYFERIKNREDFIKQVPVNDYEGLRSYIDRVVKGEPDVLWTGKPLYLSKTSGTTSGAKYIPLSKESLPEHIRAARNALLLYIYNSGNADFVDGKMIFLQGSPILSKKAGILTGRLSGIVAHHVPGYLQANRKPSYEVNCIEDWEEKVDAIVKETLPEKMSLISGIPAWVQMYFERLIELSGKASISEVFPKFSLLVYGGVNFQPYAQRFHQLIGKKVDTVELFPASEGFFAYQDRQDDDGLLLNTNAGMYYEFVPMEEIGKAHPKTLELHEVEVGVSYALVITTNAGLWRYDIGDLVRFTSLKPYKIRVAGRTKHFTSAFGEHVIAEEVEKAMSQAQEKTGAVVTEFTLAPKVAPEKGLPYHEWFIEFKKEPTDWKSFIKNLDDALRAQNPYYDDLIKGNILEELHVVKIKRGGFLSFMKSRGKLGGQNKIPRLSNGRELAEELQNWSEESVSLSTFS